MGRLINILVNEVAHRRINRSIDNNPVDMSMLTLGGHSEKHAQARQETDTGKESDESHCTATLSHARDALFLGVPL